MLSKERSAELLVAAMVYVGAFASFWPGCVHCRPLGSATAMAMSANTSDAPCAHHVSDQSFGDCGGLTEACLGVDWDKAEAAQFANPVPVPLAAALPGGHDNDRGIYRMRRAVPAPVRAPDPPPPVPQSPVALKTLFRN